MADLKMPSPVLTVDARTLWLSDQSPKPRVALVTGASGTIGGAIARQLAEDGYNLLLHAHTQHERLEAIREELQFLYPEQAFYTLLRDLSEPGAGTRLIADCERLYQAPAIFVHAAGTANIAPINDLSPETYQSLQHLHLETPLFACQALCPHLLQEHWGRVVLISSIWGLHGASCEVAYSALKGGVIALTKALAKEWGPSGITVNAVAPGVIDTEMNHRLDRLTIAELVEQIPVGRLGTGEDVAAAVSFFCSESASYTTGQILSPNGGMYT